MIIIEKDHMQMQMFHKYIISLNPVKQSAAMEQQSLVLYCGTRVNSRKFLK